MNAAWDRAFPDCTHDAAGRRTPQRMRFGLTALTTLPWAQDIGHAPDPEAITTLLQTAAEPFIVLDLPATMTPPELPSGSWAVEHHTRQSALHPNEDPVDAWPPTRRKQLRRAEREGMAADQTDDLDLLVHLHQAARDRKGLKSDARGLRALLEQLLKEPDTHAWAVRKASGHVLAGGVFHGTGDGRCVYGFGGQFRTEEPGESSRASVLLIATAMRHAATLGASPFDFGGSRDAGVDRFYAEFGAERVPKWKLVRIQGLWKPILRWQRPDLFPG